MGLPTDVRVVALEPLTAESVFRTPLKFGGQVVTHSLNHGVRLTVETRDGRTATGEGWMPAGSVWGFPSQLVSGPTAAAVGHELFQRAVAATASCQEYGHPIDLALGLEPTWLDLAASLSAAHQLGEPIPLLYALVCTSPIDAALHDAYGKALGRNVYDCYGPEFLPRDLSHYLTPAYAGQWLDRYTLRQPQAWMPLYHLVGALDPLTPSDVAQPIGDGLPEDLLEWIAWDDLTHLKIKLNGDDVEWDAQRVAGVERAASEGMARLGRDTWTYSLDFNERCRNVDYILEFLARTAELAPTAFARVAYIEQPTARDLRAHPENKMHRAAAIKPVVIDESLTNLESYELAKEQGYSGVALKTCKGQSHALLLGAAAQHDGLFLCVQDLTCPGAAFLHSAGLAARMPTITAIEGNARQFCPGSNAAWAAVYPSLFKPTGGRIQTGLLTKAGLGH
ncbi:MAG: mandelate racemase/muconate lactonizing enzyme family protein [Fimbriimonadaceae bacterium]|nr:mandelate racemase/muconate lactonizing enzyme family protein [Fimbriimonadaceae bacterium]